MSLLKIDFYSKYDYIDKNNTYPGFHIIAQ